jgi:hypothetical protein
LYCGGFIFCNVWVDGCVCVGCVMCGCSVICIQLPWLGLFHAFSSVVKQMPG